MRTSEFIFNVAGKMSNPRQKWRCADARPAHRCRPHRFFPPLRARTKDYDGERTSRPQLTLAGHQAKFGRRAKR